MIILNRWRDRIDAFSGYSFRNSMSERDAVAFVGTSGSGKTTVICALLPILKQRFHRIVVIKSTHHGEPASGGDTARFLAAGADETVLVSGHSGWRWTRDGGPEALVVTSPIDLVAETSADLVILEGFKSFAAWPRILVRRSGIESPSLDAAALVTDEAIGDGKVFTFQQMPDLAAFVDTITAR